MPGLRILNVHPRLAGSLQTPARWRQIFELAATTGFNAVWLNPFHRTTEVEFEEHGKRRRRSLYAIADHDALDVAVTSGEAARDRAELAALIGHARGLGVRVMIDLVINHVAIDHPLVLAEDARVRERREEAGQGGWLFARNERLEATDFDGGTGFDNAQVDFASAAAWRCLLGEDGGELGCWKQLIDEYLALGVRGFRCDMAYSVPASWWRELIAYARHRVGNGGDGDGDDDDVVFLAETLGGKERNLQLIEARLPEGGGDGGDVSSPQGRLAFELSMLSTSWWDLQAAWLLEEIALTHRLAHHGGAGSPDNHDLEQTLAQRLLRELRAARPPRGLEDELAIQRAVAALCVRNYAVAALVGNSVYATLGYLFCLDQSSVFWEPELMERLERDRQARGERTHPLNLCSRIAAINDFLRRLPLAQARVSLAEAPRPPRSSLGEPAPGTAVAFEVLLHHVGSGALLGRLAVAVDRSYELGGVASEAVAERLIEQLTAAIASEALPKLRQILRELDQERIEPSETLAPGGEAEAAAPLWLETPLLVACFRAVPADPNERTSS
jgi:hypothetical protein